MSYIASWLTPELFTRIFPYACISSVYTHNNTPFWDLVSFISAVNWMNNHQNKQFHGFGTTKLEVAAFLANVAQETGDPSLQIPYPYSWPKPAPRTGPEFNNSGAGGLTCLIEGCATALVTYPQGTKCPVSGVIIKPITLTDFNRSLIGIDTGTILAAYITDFKGVNQPGFGLANATFQPGLAAVSNEGVLYTSSPKTSETAKVFAQYSGRGAIQLSYNYNYSYCSMDLFGDQRLVKYPNLIVTSDRDTFNGFPEIFGFPGPNPNGANPLPSYIYNTTPPAKMMAWITAIWFWMTLRSGRSISCHTCMTQPTVYGITSTNLIVNNDSGCSPGWAAEKVAFYKRICNILGIDYTGTIVCPSRPF